MRIRRSRAVLGAGLLFMISTATAAQDNTASALIARADSVDETDARAALDLVKRALKQLDTDDVALRLAAMRIRCWTAAEAEPDSLQAYAASGVAAAEVAKDDLATAQLRVCRGYARESGGDEPGAFEDYDAAATVGRRLGDRDLLAEALVLRGEVEYSRGDFTSAVRDLNESYQLFQALGRADKVRYALNAMANLYADSRMGQYDRALEYYRQLLAAHQAAGRDRGVATAYFNIGSTLEQMKRLDEALVEYRRGLAIDTKRADADEIAADRRAVGVVLYKLGRPADALRELEQSLAHYVRTKDTAGMARVRLNRGIALRMLKRTNEAIADLEFAFAHFRESGNKRYLEKIHEERGIAYAAAGRWSEAYDARVDQLAAQKALEAEAREEQSARLRMQFQSEKKERENLALARENAATARVRRLQVAVIALAGIIIVALAGFIGRQMLASRRLRTLAMVDELTQVANRRAIMQLAEDRLRAAKGGGPGFALLALDVDHFKHINDTFGHEAGDRVLRAVADALRLALRPGDHVGRTGGEEFVVILPGASVSAAREVAERLRAAVANCDFSETNPALSVTISVGAAVWTTADRSVGDLHRRADASLYDVKRAGRNQVLVAG
jgi:diguanylate cyclase (GGDEF)-like protein